MEIISLGLNCAGIEHYVRNNLEKNKLNGRKTLPFDLCMTTYSGLIYSIKTNFINITNVELINNLYNEKYKFPNNALFYSPAAGKPYNDNLIVNKNYGMYFNHESPGHPFLYQTEKWESKDKYTKNNFELFNKRYSDRVKNFNEKINYCIDNNITLIFLLNSNFTPIKLKRTIQEKYKNLKFKILCNKLDGQSMKLLKYLEDDVCNYDIISEIEYDMNYNDQDEIIIMNGWEKLNNFDPSQF